MKNIELYYESIKQVYKRIQEWENRPEPIGKRLTNFLLGFSIVLFLLSLIPIIPSILIYSGSQLGWKIFSYNLSQSSIWTYALGWLIFTVLTLPIIPISIGLQNKFDREDEDIDKKAPQSLSSEQLAFIFAYESYKELKIFFVSHIDQHVENSLMSLKRLFDRAPIFIADQLYSKQHVDKEMIYELERSKSRSYRFGSSLIREIYVAQEFLRAFEKYPWFHIDNDTRVRLQALTSFQRKTIIRLRKREDLPAVLSILENFSKFLYAFLPEHKTNIEDAKLNELQEIGTNCLDQFVEEVDKLIELPSDHSEKEKRKDSDQPRKVSKLRELFLSNVFIRFTVWLIAIIVITSGLVLLTSLRIPNLDINIMVSMIITASVTGAAALAVFGGKSKHNNDDQKNGNNSDMELSNNNE